MGFADGLDRGMTRKKLRVTKTFGGDNLKNRVAILEKDVNVEGGDLKARIKI